MGYNPSYNGISKVNPLIVGVITHLLSGMSHQVETLFKSPTILIPVDERPSTDGISSGISIECSEESPLDFVSKPA